VADMTNERTSILVAARRFTAHTGRRHFPAEATMIRVKPLCQGGRDNVIAAAGVALLDMLERA
jgi:hypothetical protein